VSGADAAGRPRVVWFAIARAPYHDFFFGKLAERVRLTVVYAEKAASHPWQLGDAGHDARHLEDDPVGALRLAWSADAIVFQGWHQARLVALMALLSPFVPKAFWTDTPRVGPARGWKEHVRAGVIAGVFRRFDQIWSTGRPGVEALLALGCPPAKVRSLPFFTDLDAYPRAHAAGREAALGVRHRHGASDEQVVFLVSGRLAENKRVDDVLRALASTPDGAVLWVAGEGAERARCEALARSLGVEARTRFLGWVEPQELPAVWLACDVAVHAAEADPFPNVVRSRRATGRRWPRTCDVSSTIRRWRGAWVRRRGGRPARIPSKKASASWKRSWRRAADRQRCAAAMSSMMASSERVGRQPMSLPIFSIDGTRRSMSSKPSP